MGSGCAPRANLAESLRNFYGNFCPVSNPRFDYEFGFAVRADNGVGRNPNKIQALSKKILDNHSDYW